MKTDPIKRIWIVNPFDNLPTDNGFQGRYQTLGSLLIKKGYAIDWFTANWSHLEKKYRTNGLASKTIQPNYRIHYLPVRSYQKNISITRVLSHRDYAYSLKRFTDKNLPKPSLIVVSLPIRDAVNTICKYAKENSIPVVVDIQDLFPENLYELFPKCLKPLIWPAIQKFKWLDDNAIRSASALYAVSNSYLQRGIRVFPLRKNILSSYTYIGIDLDKFDAIDDFSDVGMENEPPYLIFCGTLGQLSDLWVVFDALKIINEKHTLVTLKIYGDGPQYAALQEYAQKNSLPVIFYGRQPWKTCVRSIRSAFAGLNVYQPINNAVSNKAFEYMAGEVPVINSVSGEVAQLIAQHNAGNNFCTGDSSQLANIILKMLAEPKQNREMGKNARKFVEQFADRTASYHSYVSFLESVMENYS